MRHGLATLGFNQSLSGNKPATFLPDKVVCGVSWRSEHPNFWDWFRGAIDEQVDQSKEEESYGA